MEIVTQKPSMWWNIQIPPNKRFTVPDEIGQALCDRGVAEKISEDVLKKENKKGK